MTQEVLKYLEICEPQPENLTKSEIRGLKKLKKRIEKGDSVYIALIMDIHEVVKAVST